MVSGLAEVVMFTTTSIDRNLILTGYMGPTQLVIARHTAERLRLRFVDFEQLFEARAGSSRDDMRGLYGEARLKALESELVNEIVLYRGTVLHIGGQTLMHSSHLARLSETGDVIALVAALDVVLHRLHLALGARYHNPRERELALGVLKREWAVRKCAGIIEFDTSTLSEAEMVDALAARWREVSGVIDWRA
jgi:shikimate kinase